MNTSQLYQLFVRHPRISIDSRNIIKDSLFFALKGEYHDANLFAEQALQNGAAFAIVDNAEIIKSNQYIFVENVLAALQMLATYHRSKFNIPVIAITGSNGKTTTKELIAKVFGKKYHTLFTEGNLNNHIGLPLSLLKLKEHHEMAVLEMGANHIGEIKTLCEIARPVYGLITNIGHAHLEGFGSFEGVVSAKTELYDFIRQHQGKVFVNQNDELLMKHAQDISHVTYGMNTEANFQATILKEHPFLVLECRENCSSFELHTQLTGSYNACNIMAALCIGRYFGVSAGDVKQAIASYLPENNRSQIVETKNNKIILDAYNANPSSMLAALQHFKAIPDQQKMCILGDMLELGDYAPAEHQKILNLAKNSGFSKLIFIGEEFLKMSSHHPEYLFFKSTPEANNWLAKQKISNNTILLKGSRKIQLETLIDNL
jgi:UDP-N-acetylmuramoyl-tripeptide--D-alanyl-D-alanine ligase